MGLTEMNNEAIGEERTKRVLIVDDEPQIVKIVGMRLKAKGYEVVEANDVTYRIPVGGTREPVNETIIGLVKEAFAAGRSPALTGAALLARVWR